MGVTNGQSVNAAVTNAAFIAKNVDDSTPSLLGLLNTDTSSGPTISNAQKEINNKRYTPSNSTVSASAIIVLTDQVGLQTIRVVSDGGAVSASITLFGTTDTNWPDGREVKVMGTSDTDTVQLTHNDADHGALLNGNAVLGRGKMVVLQWWNSELRWVEVSRNF